MKVATLAYWLHAFFHEWLAQQRNMSHHTVLSYRDTWRLFLKFVAARERRSVSDLALEHLTANEVMAFLRYSEEERKVTIGTRNCRLAALRSFFRFVAEREPLAVAQCTEVLRIPTKKAPTSEVNYLDADEVTAILRQPDRSTLKGQRDHALLALLYNTGARIQEALDLCPRSVRLRSPAQVTLNLPALAGNGGPADRVAQEAAEVGGPTDFSESLWPAARRCRRTLQARALLSASGKGCAYVEAKARHAAHIQALDGCGHGGRRR